MATGRVTVYGKCTSDSLEQNDKWVSDSLEQNGKWMSDSLLQNDSPGLNGWGTV